MNKKILFVLVSVLAAWLPISPALASYDTVTWGKETVLYFSGVAAVAGGQEGVSVSIFGDSYLNKYTLDNNKLVVELYPGSKINLKSTDRKMFRTDIVTAETVCADTYSTFSYSTPENYANFTITLSDADNCPTAVTKTEEPAKTEVEQIDVTKLDKITTSGLIKSLGQNSKTHFVFGTVVETIDVLSVSTAEAKITLSTPSKELNLELGKRKTVDTDADGWNDLGLTLKSTSGGRAELEMRKIEPIKITGVEPGDLIKIDGSKAVYYVGADSQLYVFPNDKVYFTWYSNFNNVKTVSSEDLAKFAWGGLVTYRPGVKMVKFAVGNDVYTVSKGGVLRKLKDEAMAKAFYGDNWNKKIDDVSEAFYFSYKIGADLAGASDYSKEEAGQLSPAIGIDKEI